MDIRWKQVLISPLLLASACAMAAGPTTRPAGIINDAPRPHLDVPQCATVPSVTADPNDLAWDAAVTIDHLDLSLGAIPCPQLPATTVKLTWDERYLYVRFICTDDSLESPYRERDADHHKGDVVEAFIDPVGDSRQYVELQVGPDNQVLDQLFLLTADARSGPDLRLLSEVYPRNVWALREWDMPDLRTAATHQIVDGKLQGWTVDMAIPAAPLLKRLGTQQFAPNQQLRINLLRYEQTIQGSGQKQFIPLNWSPVVAGNPHSSPAAMGSISLKPHKAPQAQ